MTNNRVLNMTRGFTLKHKQALRAVDECACAWVEFGVSVRDLSIMEALERRAQQVKIADPLPFAELPGCIYRPTEANQAGARTERVLALAANEFWRATVQA